MANSFRFNDVEFARMKARGGSINNAVARAAGRTRDRVKLNITTAGIVDTGRLRQSIVVEPGKVSSGKVTYLVGSDLDYAVIQEEGRGPVFPRRAKVLRFMPKGGGAFVFAPSVKAVAGVHFLRDALDALSARDFE